ncbi:hypothetical protein [Rhizobium skierniewicense]|uniref:hypothetical protein n=1 Tax=Rhizobium skierniewicense TaxID=984260 RepID=UPI001FAC6B1C|nr:hypothetical protein [Rhizobium skierniewicense]
MTDQSPIAAQAQRFNMLSVQIRLPSRAVAANNLLHEHTVEEHCYLVVGQLYAALSTHVLRLSPSRPKFQAAFLFYAALSSGFRNGKRKRW